MTRLQRYESNAIQKSKSHVYFPKRTSLRSIQSKLGIIFHKIPTKTTIKETSKKTPESANNIRYMIMTHLQTSYKCLKLTAYVLTRLLGHHLHEFRDM